MSKILFSNLQLTKGQYIMDSNTTKNNTTDTNPEAKFNADDLAKMQNRMRFVTALHDCFKPLDDRDLDAFDEIQVNNGENANNLILDIFYAGFIITSELIDQEGMDPYDYINMITRLLAQKQIDESNEFRTPKKPYWRIEKDEDGYVCAEGYACPRCDMGVTTDHGQIRESFCSDCGQALDWNDIPRNE